MNMKKILVRSTSVYIFLALAFSITAWSVSLTNRQAETKMSQNVNSEQRKSMRQRVQERDVEVELVATEDNAQKSSIQSLKKNAIAIIVGHIAEENSYFDGDDGIVTNYSVEIQRVLKDNTSNWPYLGFTPPTPLTSPLKVIRDGGEVHVNGHRASMKLEGSEMLKPNKDYVLFLRWSPDFKAYRPVGGVSGFFVVEDSRIKPVGSKKEIKKHDGAALQTFVDEILRADN
jgi:hypothetical protein